MSCESCTLVAACRAADASTSPLSCVRATACDRASTARRARRAARPSSSDCTMVALALVTSPVSFLSVLPDCSSRYFSRSALSLATALRSSASARLSLSWASSTCLVTEAIVSSASSWLRFAPRRTADTARDCFRCTLRVSSFHFWMSSVCLPTAATCCALTPESSCAALSSPCERASPMATLAASMASPTRSVRLATLSRSRVRTPSLAASSASFQAVLEAVRLPLRKAVSSSSRVMAAATSSLSPLRRACSDVSDAIRSSLALARSSASPSSAPSSSSWYPEIFARTACRLALPWSSPRLFDASKCSRMAPSVDEMLAARACTSPDSLERSCCAAACCLRFSASFACCSLASTPARRALKSVVCAESSAFHACASCCPCSILPSCCVLTKACCAVQSLTCLSSPASLSLSALLSSACAAASLTVSAPSLARKAASISWSALVVSFLTPSSLDASLPWRSLRSASRCAASLALASCSACTSDVRSSPTRPKVSSPCLCRASVLVFMAVSSSSIFCSSSLDRSACSRAICSRDSSICASRAVTLASSPLRRPVMALLRSALPSSSAWMPSCWCSLLAACSCPCSVSLPRSASSAALALLDSAEMVFRTPWTPVSMRCIVSALALSISCVTLVRSSATSFTVLAEIASRSAASLRSCASILLVMASKWAPSRVSMLARFFLTTLMASEILASAAFCSFSIFSVKSRTPWIPRCSSSCCSIIFCVSCALWLSMRLISRAAIRASRFSSVDILLLTSSSPFVTYVCRLSRVSLMSLVMCLNMSECRSPISSWIL
mmetsp:Transcript_7157/g.18246  ORF Transcript_7157/g.18246 Transcript_7157/m.18246 type:complete len:791 (+) Transcript_7157:1144-3516(+)